MSTTFAVPVKPVNLEDLSQTELGNEDGVFEYISKQYFEEVWFRSMGNCRWLNPLAELLPDHTRVYAMDNTQQGLYIIGDIKGIMAKQAAGEKW
jgi:hypothetical protein